MIKIIKSHLYKFPLTQLIRNYMQGFWDEYRLQENAQALLITPKQNQMPGEKISLVVVSETEIDTNHWLPDLFAVDSNLIEIIWVQKRYDATLRDAGPNQDKFIKRAIPKQISGKDLNCAINSSSNSLVLLINTKVNITKKWLVTLLTPFEEREKNILFSLGQIQPSPSWKSLALHEETQANLPYMGFAFRKQAWAQAGGFPDELPLHSALSLFRLRLKSLAGVYAVNPNNIAAIENKPTIMKKFWQGFEEGQLGLSGGSFRKYIAFLALSVLFLLGIFTPFFLSINALAPVCLLLLITSTIFQGSRIKQGQPTNFPIHPWHLFLLGFLQQTHSAGYLTGLFRYKLTRRNLEEASKKQLVEIINKQNNIKGIVIYLATHDWGFMFQRPQQLARHFARAGYLYFYCTRNEHTDTIVGFQEIEPNLFVCAVPPETFTIVQNPIFLIGSAWYAPMLQWFKNPVIIYDHYDDLEVSAARVEDHQFLLDKADIILASSQILFDHVAKTRPDCLLIPNAVDYDFVQQMNPHKKQAFLPELEHYIKNNIPIIGYSGALAKWFDYDLMKAIAKLRPQWQFVLIGIDYDGTLEESGLLSETNIRYLGWKPYQELFDYVWLFSIAIIPFIINDITKATSPVKLFEYFACQKPVVATPLPECLPYSEVLIAANASDFIKKIEQSLENKNDPKFLARLDATARLNTWQARIEQITKSLVTINR